MLSVVRGEQNHGLREKLKNNHRAVKKATFSFTSASFYA